MREKKDKDCMIQNTWRAYLFVSSFQTKSGSNITEQYKTHGEHIYLSRPSRLNQVVI
jgi:hypothetical protein